MPGVTPALDRPLDPLQHSKSTHTVLGIPIRSLVLSIDSMGCQTHTHDLI